MKTTLNDIIILSNNLSKQCQLILANEKTNLKVVTETCLSQDVLRLWHGLSTAL